MSELTQKYDKNRVTQIIKEGERELVSANAVIDSWRNAFVFNSNKTKGLRLPQIGALFAIKAHWTVSRDPATVVMPTGTGKTETMIAALVSEQIKRTLVIVPSDLLRKQTVKKFLTLGVLPEIGVITPDARMPAVAVLNSTPKTESDFSELVDRANVIVSTVTLLQRFSDAMLNILAEACDLLVVDEAHHIAAKTWASVKQRLSNLKCLQFTATPFRNDGKKLDGKIIYNFPLALAQQQGYFQKINYCPLWEFDEERGDLSIASAAVSQLKADLDAGFNHAILVRAKDKRSANKLYNEVYAPRFPEFNPVLIHSDIPPNEKHERMTSLKSGDARIVVCVDMFGEGIDIPNLKIAAIHDKYKSLPITLQFVGRFARTSSGLGEATLITNIANDELNENLRDLYAQDADWNTLLQVKSSEEIGKEIADQEFSQEFSLPVVNGVAIHQMRPKVSMTAYYANQEQWNTDAISNLFDEDKFMLTINQEQNVIAVIERVDTHASWTSFRGITDTTWNLHLAYWNPAQQLLFINSTVKGFSDKFAETLFVGCSRIKGENVFRCLHGINRLMLGTVGLLSAIDGPIRFKMFAGIDVETGISESLKHNSFKSNLFGVGYNGHGKASIGCSHKGRIWSRWVESIGYWMSWCDEIGQRLLDENIDTKTILSGALVPVIAVQRPMSMPYGIEWPQDLDVLLEDRIEFERMNKSYPYYEMDISLVNPSADGPLLFAVGNEEIEEQFELQITENDFKVVAKKSAGLMIRLGKNSYKLSEYFREHPPRIKFVDQSILEGNYLVKANSTPPSFNRSNIIPLDWVGIDIRKESQKKTRETDSIQYRMIQDLKQTGIYEIIFDDDGAGEIADIVTINEADGHIYFGFFHCKYSTEDTPGARVDDLYAVCGQAEKSIKWCNDTKLIIERLIKREMMRQKDNATRIEVGSLRKLNEIKNKLRVYPSSVDITIVQPGVDSKALSEDMSQLLSGTAAYLLETYGISLKLVCS